MLQVNNLDFLNLNSLRNYPIKENCSRLDTSTVLTIPNDLIVDIQLAASSAVDLRCYIASLTNLTTSIIITVADHDDLVIGTFSITKSTATKYGEYLLDPTADYIGAAGRLVIGDLTGINKQPIGIYSFAFANTELETRTIIPSVKGINRMLFVNADGKSFSQTANVKIVARTNVRFSYDEAHGVIILDAGENIGLNTKCEEVAPCIQTINSVPPDFAGNFTLDADGCAQFNVIAANTGLLLTDTCYQACMGCEDLTALTTRAMAIENRLLSLSKYCGSLDASLQSLKESVTYNCNC